MSTDDQIVEALDFHRWRTMGVSTVGCECGEILYGDGALTRFPADEAFRQHLAEVIEPIIKAREAEAWLKGVRFSRRPGILPSNPYRAAS